MAKISLRAYNREIETMIERGKTNEAIGHCKHILKSFPKCLDTYRILGKSFLESQRYAEAADIFERVLAAIPDDYIAHLGMSIIREDEGNLDAAIWHMERVFEVQPSNAAFQAELRRLYGRRDGIEPPKIRLTRGALVRMYAKGELFPQATAEIRAALAEDPKRIDLESILASVYYKAGRKVEATEICSRIVAKAPYNLEANRILSEILPSTSRADDALFYQARLQSMDPYTAYTNPEQPSSEDVPDQTVHLEHLDWQPSQDESSQPAWTQAIGVQWEETEHDTEPDWLIAARQTESQNQDNATEPDQTPAAEALPDFLTGAGWTASAEDLTAQPESQLSGEFEESLNLVTDDTGLADADIPDWLAAMAPSEPSQETAPEESERSEWLSNILGAPTEAEAPRELPAEITPPDWLASAEPLQSAGLPAESAIPDWLSEMEPDEATIVPDQKNISGLPPEWLAGESPATEPEPLEATNEEAIPGWLAELGKADTAQETASESLSLGSEPTESDWLTESNQQPINDTPSGEPAQDVPSWLAELASEEPAASSELVEPITSENIEPAPSANFMETDLPIRSSLEANPIFEETISEVNPIDLTAMEQQVETVNAEAPLAESVEEIISSSATELPEEPAHISSATEGPTEGDIDSALAWLESLAVKQGADEDFLLVSADKRTEQPPDWLANVSDLSTAELSKEEPEKAEFTQEQNLTANLADQLADEISASEQQLPEWLSAAEAATEQAIQSESPLLDASIIPDLLASATDKPSSEAETALPEWLAEDVDQSQPESVSPTEESVPDWLAGLETLEEGLTVETASEQELVSDSIETPLLVNSSAEVEPQLQVADQAEITHVTESEFENKLETPASTVPSEGDIDSALAWLESLAVKQGADEDFLLVSAEERIDTPPEWLSSTAASPELKTNETPMQEEAPLAIEELPLSISDEQGTDTPVLETTEELPAWLTDVGLKAQESTPLESIGEFPSIAKFETQPLPEDLEQELDITHPTDITSGLQVESEDKDNSDQVESQASKVDIQDLAQPPVQTSESEIDSALAWLESLAVKQGADADFLFVAESDRTEKPPEWVEEAAAAVEEQPDAEIITADETTAEIPDVLKGVASVTEEIPQQEEELTTPAHELEIPGSQPETSLEEIVAPEESVEIEPTEAVLPEMESVASDWISTPPNQTEEEPESVEAWLSSIVAEEGTTSTTPEETFTAWETLENTETSPSVEPVPSIESNEITADPGKALEIAQASMNLGNLDQSLEIYNTLISNNLNIEESIHNLREATYRFPINVSLWQTLGDAYARNNALQDALDAYTKAEEMLR